MPNLVHHVHGKKRVRLARTWREGDVHHFVEWMVEVIIESDMEHAYKTPSNEGMTTTDTTKNQCYVVAKQMSQRRGGWARGVLGETWIEKGMGDPLEYFLLHTTGSSPVPFLNATASIGHTPLRAILSLLIKP